MFSSLYSRLMLAFSALLLVCLCIVMVTFTLLFFFGVSLPSLAHTHMTNAALPVVAHLRSEREANVRLEDRFSALRELADREGVRLLLVSAPDSTIRADTGQQWVGQKVRLSTPPRDGAIRASLRGRTRGPDGRLLFYVAVPLQEASEEQGSRTVLVLTMTVWETVRPFIGSMLASVLLSGAAAFALSAPFALWLARTLARPLQRAAAAAEQVAAGDYAVSLDIAAPDEARRLAESFNAMTGAVAASQRSQRDFVANVSHELRTPLTSIRGFAQAIVDGTARDQASVQRAASVIHGEADRLSRMVHTLLDLTRIESGEIPMSWSRIDLAALLRSCVARFAPLAKERDLEVHTDLPGELYITADGDRLVQVFTNLIDNGLRHTDAGGRLTMTASEGDGMVHVSVVDTGCGIAEEDLPRVFERFYRADRSRSRGDAAQSDSVGLGLAISSEIVRAHGGEIGVESIAGLGSRFTVTLPREPRDDAGADAEGGGSL